VALDDASDPDDVHAAPSLNKWTGCVGFPSRVSGRS
jgi:hypothetical protein